jgi:hypothetical protein
MAKIDAVIAALHAVLREAESRTTTYRWQTKIVNRWINQLPGAWRWRWRHLKLRGGIDREVGRDAFIGHVRATLAYLENNRDEIQSAGPRRWLPTLRRRQSSASGSPPGVKRVLH